MDFLKNKMVRTQADLEYFLRKGNKTKIREQISAMGYDTSLLEVILLDPEGKVDASMHLGHLQHTLEDDLFHESAQLSHEFSTYILKTVDQLKNSKKLFIENNQIHKKLLAIYPVQYTSEHSLRLLQGKLIIVEDISHIDSEVAQQLQKQLFPLMLFMLISSIFLSVVLHFFIVHRINRLNEDTVLYTKGDKDVSFEVYGHDEISNLGKTFRTMVQDSEQQNRLIINKEKYLALTLDSIKEAIIATDEEGNITRINPAALQLTAYSYEEAIGKKIDDVFKFSYAATQQEEENEINQVSQLSKTTANRNLVLESKDNKRYQVSSSIAPIIEEGNTIGIILIFRDVTTEYQAQEELRRYRKDLESLVSERTKELEDSILELTNAQDKLVESEKMASLGSLVAGISHELNTPIGLSYTGITHIQSLTKEIEERIKTQSLKQSSLTNYLEDVSLMSKSMRLSLLKATELIRSFKQIAIDQHAENLREFNLFAYIDDVILSLRSTIKHANIQIDNRIPPDINLYSYPGTFSQIITNFINNAAMHAFDMQEQKMISISATQDKEILTFIYEDNGNGMSEDVLRHIFDPFFTTKLGQGGNGLGMHIVYNLVTQKLHGEIECQSTLNKGTRFTISMPTKEKDA